MDSIQRNGITPRFADSVEHKGVVYTVEVPDVEVDDIRKQTQSMLENLDASLSRAGSNKSQLLMATVYLTDMNDYAAMNEVWESWLPIGCAPARACLQVTALAKPAWKVEVVIVAACG